MSFPWTIKSVARIWISRSNKAFLKTDSFENVKQHIQCKATFHWCIHKSHVFKMEPLPNRAAARIITSNHITRLWTTTKTPELIPSSGYLITGLLSGWLLFSCSSSFTSTSLSSLLYRIKICYLHFNVFNTQKGLRCKFFYIFWVQVSALLLSFLKAFLDNSTRREVCAVGKSMLSVA